MKLIDRYELENRLSALLDKLDVDVDIIENILDEIEDMPYLDVIKLKNGDLKGKWRE